MPPVFDLGLTVLNITPTFLGRRPVAGVLVNGVVLRDDMRARGDYIRA
ncbi:hypothetical protein [Gordonia insulae]|uniref:Uncharacterized protein n=1 Tax=Gordonia insulae TaxID=2420509 RepID=A0A3G8JJ36_9ACTN|nr:hypothetical protein [Gordonia insulae]AZG44489.1 hypothetical protein D7316_01075 [Gordonia insulae]